VTRDELGLEHRGQDQPTHSCDAKGATARVTVLTPGLAAALAALVITAVYLDGSPQSRPAGQVGLGEGAGPARAIGFRPEGTVLTATWLDWTVRLWRIDPGSGRAEPLGPAVPGRIAALAPDGATLAVGGLAAVTLWDGATDRPLRTLPTGDGPTFALAFRRDGGALAAAGERAVTVWDLAPGREGAVTRLLPCEAKCLVFALDGRSLATGGLDGLVRVWDLETGQLRFAVRSHVYYLTSLAVSDDGRTLASASDCDRVARLCDAATGRSIAELRGHTAPVLAVAFVPGGKMVATAGMDGTVRLWDVRSGRERACLRCPRVTPGTLAFSDDGRSLAVGGFEPEVRVWDVSGASGH
jgi:WD40 repeat protein